MICVLDLGINVNFSEQKGNWRDSKCENSTTPCCWPWDVGSLEQGPVRSLMELTADFGWQPSRKQDLNPTNIRQEILPTTRKTSWTNPTSDLQNCEIINLYCFNLLKRKRQWHPTPVLLPGKSHGWRSLVGYSQWGHKESDTTEWCHFHLAFSIRNDSSDWGSLLFTMAVLYLGKLKICLRMMCEKKKKEWCVTAVICINLFLVILNELNVCSLDTSHKIW